MIYLNEKLYQLLKYNINFVFNYFNSNVYVSYTDESITVKYNNFINIINKDKISIKNIFPIDEVTYKNNYIIL